MGRLRSASWISSFVSITVFMSSCGGDNVTSTAPSSPEASPVPNTVAIEPVPAPSPNANAQAPEAGQLLPVPNLIPPTTQLERLPQIRVGRSDPFASLPTTPIVTPIVAPANSPVAPASPPAAQSVGTNPPALQPLPLQALPPLQPLAVAPFPEGQLPTVPLQAPPAFQPGSDIVVSGVVQIGDRASAIVTLPGDQTSRYVYEGDYLSGRILVKRIEMGLEPRVILEREGVEIVRTVGSLGGSM